MMSGPARTNLGLMVLWALVLTVAPAKAMAVGEITQKLEAAGCFSVTGADGKGRMTCTDGRALRLATTVAVSPDGGSVYVTSHVDDAIAIFDRAEDGTLTQKPGAAGCISETGADGEEGTPCAVGRALEGAAMVGVSPDGRSVYVTALDRNDQSAQENDKNGNALAIFDRAEDGTLTQKAGTAGCISQTGVDGEGAMTCADGRALDEAAVVGFSPDGTSVYMTAYDRSDDDDEDILPDGNSIAIFDRAPSGALTQKAGAAGCISEAGDDNDGGFTCTVGRGFGGAGVIAISPDGATAYMTGYDHGGNGSGLLVFDRAANGTLTQKPGAAGCISQTGADGEGGFTCADGRLLDEATVVAVSPDGGSVYVAASGPGSSGVSVFDRASDGTLTEKPGSAGCVSQNGGDGDGGSTCAVGRALGTAAMVLVSPDGASVYVTGVGDSAINIFDRAADGTLTQKPGTAGCVSDGGQDGAGAATCADGRALGNVAVLAVSPDGRSLYATTLHRFSGIGISVFDRVAGAIPTPTPAPAIIPAPFPTGFPPPAPPPTAKPAPQPVVLKGSKKRQVTIRCVVRAGQVRCTATIKRASGKRAEVTLLRGRTVVARGKTRRAKGGKVALRGEKGMRPGRHTLKVKLGAGKKATRLTLRFSMR